jgi:hypothetical protein
MQDNKDSTLHAAVSPLEASLLFHGQLMRKSYDAPGFLSRSMKRARLSAKERGQIKAHVKRHQMSLAIIKTELAPPDLVPLFEDIGRLCGLVVRRTMSSPSSDFGFAELDSDSKILIILYIGGESTELVSVSETEHSAIKELEESLHLSNFQSEVVRLGL